MNTVLNAVQAAYLKSKPAHMMVSSFTLQTNTIMNADSSGRPKSAVIGDSLRQRLSPQHCRFGLRGGLKDRLDVIQAALKAICGADLKLENSFRSREYPQIIAAHLISIAKERGYKAEQMPTDVPQIIGNAALWHLIGKDGDSHNEGLKGVESAIKSKISSIEKQELLLAAATTDKEKSRISKKLATIREELTEKEEELKARKDGTFFKGEPKADEPEDDEDDAKDTKTSNGMDLGSGEFEIVKDLAAQALTLFVETFKGKDPGKAATKAVKDVFRKTNFTKEAVTRKYVNLFRLIFGRMTTQPQLLQSHVSTLAMAHSYSVNAISFEPDYVTAGDELQVGEKGFGFATSKDFVPQSQLYTYFSFDVHEFIEQLFGDYPNFSPATCDCILEHVTNLLLDFATGLGGSCQQSSTATDAKANLVMVELSDRQPVRHDEEFSEAVPKDVAPVLPSHEKFARSLRQFDKAYPDYVERKFLVVPEASAMLTLGPSCNEKELKAWVFAKVAGKAEKTNGIHKLAKPIVDEAHHGADAEEEED